VLRCALPHLEARGLQSNLERIARPLRHPGIVVVVMRGDRRRQGTRQGGGRRRRAAGAR
jgi:hypothetical protein